MFGFNGAEQLVTCVSLCMDDDFTFAATESELGKMRSRILRLVRGILVRGKRDVREIKKLGRSLRWTEEGLEYEATDNHRQALLEGLGLSEVSTAQRSSQRRSDNKKTRKCWSERRRRVWRRRFFTLAWTGRTCNMPRRRYARRWRTQHEDAEKC